MEVTRYAVPPEKTVEGILRFSNILPLTHATGAKDAYSFSRHAVLSEVILNDQTVPFASVQSVHLSANDVVLTNSASKEKIKCLGFIVVFIYGWNNNVDSTVSSSTVTVIFFLLNATTNVGTSTFLKVTVRLVKSITSTWKKPIK